jgi:carbon starvation protein
VNILFIPVITLIIFIFGYLYYAKLVWLRAFQGDAAPEQQAADCLNSNTAYIDAPGKDGEFSRHVSLAAHIAALASGSTIGGVAVALFWGWIPAFLWLVASAVIAGGIFGMGSLWLSLRHPGRGPEEIAAATLGRPFTSSLFILTIFICTLMAALMVWLASQLLVSHPAIVLACLLLPILAYGLGKWWRSNQSGEAGAGFGLVIIPLIIMAAVYGAAAFPVSISGAINLDMGGDIQLSIASGVLWAAIILAVSNHAASQPLRAHTRPRGFVTGSLLALLVIITLAGALFIHPDITAQNFQSPETGPSALPWIFVTITSGAIAGYHLLIANGVTAKVGLQAKDIRLIGYGGALAETTIAITAIMVIAAGFGTEQQWLGFYGDWQDVQNLPRLLELYINGFARYAAGLGLEPEFAKNLAAIILFAASATTLEAMLRILRQNLNRLQAVRYTPLLKNENRRLWVGLLLVAITSLIVIPGSKVLPFWPLLGLADLTMAVIFLALLAIILISMKRMGLMVLALAGVITLIIIGTGLSRMAQLWSSGDWPMLVPTAFIILLASLALYKGIQFARSPEKVASTESEETADDTSAAASENES